jgi:hypothetical protein
MADRAFSRVSSLLATHRLSDRERKSLFTPLSEMVVNTWKSRPGKGLHDWQNRHRPYRASPSRARPATARCTIVTWPFFSLRQESSASSQ